MRRWSVQKVASLGKDHRVRVLTVGALAVGVAALGASLPTHAWPSTVVIVIPAMAVLVLAARRPARSRQRARDPAPRLLRGVVLWSVLAAAILLWEAYAFVRQPDWSRPSHDYPTMSTLLDPVLEHGPLRLAGWLAWLGAGWWLVRR